MKISHEAPLCLMETLRPLVDYDYCLVHLLDDPNVGEEYLQYFLNSRTINPNREIILDNSIYELGEAYNSERYAYWITQINPTHYIIPDVFGDAEKTIESLENWYKNYGKELKKYKTIGVLQGSNYKDFKKCYQKIQKKVDKIAISFGYPYFINFCEEILGFLDSDWRDPQENYRAICYGHGRHFLINDLLKDDIIDKNKPHHLLGCGIPQEFSNYAWKNYDFIESLDTSHPILTGLDEVKYDEENVSFYKPYYKMIEKFENKFDQKQIKTALENVKYFRSRICQLN
jgi:hypothetical protein